MLPSCHLPSGSVIRRYRPPVWAKMINIKPRIDARKRTPIRTLMLIISGQRAAVSGQRACGRGEVQARLKLIFSRPGRRPIVVPAQAPWPQRRDNAGAPDLRRTPASGQRWGSGPPMSPLHPKEPHQCPSDVVAMVGATATMAQGCCWSRIDGPALSLPGGQQQQRCDIDAVPGPVSGRGRGRGRDLRPRAIPATVRSGRLAGHQSTPSPPPIR